MQGDFGAGDRRLKAVIFDMDNTLFEFVDAQVAACKAVVDSIGAGNKLDLFDLFLRDESGFEDHRNIADYLGSLGIYDEPTCSECCAVYDRARLAALEPYSGIRRCLSRLRRMGLKLAVVTDAGRANAEARLRKTGLRRYFDVVVPLEETGKRKPSPDPIRLALERLGVGPAESLLVGDSLSRDVVAGKAAGMATAHAAYGDKNFKEGGMGAVKADYILDGAGDICALVKGFV